MLAQDIVNASSIDFRQVLSSSAPDSALFLSWIDRISKDALHTGIYNFLLHVTQTISVTNGVSSYTLTNTSGPIRRIGMVYDRTFDRIIMPIDSILYPTSLGDQQSPRQAAQIPLEMVTAETQAQYPKYYHLEGPTTIEFFPAPQKTAFNGTYEIHYEMQAPDVTALTQTLLIPDDGEDMVVAGVNQYVANFLHLDTEAQFWSQQYEAYKKGTASA